MEAFNIMEIRIPHSCVAAEPEAELFSSRVSVLCPVGPFATRRLAEPSAAGHTWAFAR